MSRDYAISRVKDALEKSDQNQVKAHRLIMSWLEKDQTLLLGLVAPHLNSIITHAIAHVTTPPKKIDPAQVSGEFGVAMLDSLKGGGIEANFGQATPGGIAPPGQTSEAHIQAINTIVSATKGKGTSDKK